VAAGPDLWGTRQVTAYRPDIDGLRAIAVLAVVGFHAFPRTLPGGFVGVDIFFVVSGFLISTIIFGDVAAGRFTYMGFYARRVRRIFPALVTVLTATLIAGLHLGFAGEVAMIGRHVAAGAAFVSNIVLWKESGYFEIDASFKPLLHLWSLGVEEQFYIVWPLLVASVPLRRVRWVILAVLGASFVANVALVRATPTAAFFSPATRFWELMAGALLAHVAREARWPPSEGRRSLLSVVGFGLIGFALLAFDSTTLFPGWAALLPTLGAMAVIAAGPNATLNRLLLTNRLAVAIGLISYPLYLWHWPILSFMHILDGQDLARAPRVLAVVASLALAWATYAFIERPVRFGSRGRVGALLAMMIVLGAVGLSLPYVVRSSDDDEFVAHFENGAPSYRYAVAKDMFARNRDECNFFDIWTNGAKDAIDQKCFVRTSPNKIVLLWGDSHAGHLVHGLRLALPEVQLLQISTSGCAPSLKGGGSVACSRANTFALRAIRDAAPDVVLLAQREHHESTDWAELAGVLRESGAKAVMLLGPVPQWNQPLHLLIARHFWPNPPERLSSRLTAGPFATDRALIERFDTSPDIRYVSLIAGLCTPDGCLTRVGPDLREDLTTFDYGHFTLRASTRVAEGFISPVVREVLGSTPKPASR